ncbi:MAG: hypothetical protein ACOYBO_10695 [Azonexus sp.]
MGNRKSKSNLPVVARDDIPRVTITLTDESIFLTKHDRTGAPGATYPVTAASVANAFNMFGASTGLLPANTLFWQQRGGQMQIGVWIEPRTVTINIRRSKLEQWTIPLPGMIFLGSGKQYAVYAATERPAHASDRVYRCPLPNVYPDGHICQGSVPFPVCAIDTIDQAVRLFFESEFNQDLAGQALIELLKSLNGKHTFPIAQLRQTGTLAEVMGSSVEDDDDDDANTDAYGNVRFADDVWGNEENDDED